MISHCAYVPQLSYPFIYQWTFGLLSYASSFKQHAYHCYPCPLICCQVPKVYFRWLSSFGNLCNENYTIWCIFINEWHFSVCVCVHTRAHITYTHQNLSIHQVVVIWGFLGFLLAFLVCVLVYILLYSIK